MKTPKKNGAIRRQGSKKLYWKMTADELAAATAEFDREDLTNPRPLRGNKLERYKRAKALRGRPPVGGGSKAVTVTLERGLLDRVDRVVRRRKTTRSQLIARALVAELAGA